MKRLLSLILSVAMLLSLSPLTFAADANYGPNLALGKPVDFAGRITAGFVATNLTDGKPNTTAAAGSSADKKICGTGMWMVVDLGGLYELNRVILHTRHDLDAAWARQGLGVAYGVLPDYSDMTSLGEKPGAGDFKSTLNVKITDATVARYVAMYCFKAGAGNVAGELEVFGSPYSGEGTGDFFDIKTPAQKNATKLLYNLDVMDGVSKTEFGVDDLITRGEAAEIICKMVGISEPTGYRDEFMDVAADHPYASYIQAGVDYGFISKDTHYRPDDYLLGYELLKMILCVNGHYEKPVHGNLYPSKIIAIANDLDLLDGADTDGWSNIGKGSVAVVLYNTFLSNQFVYQNGMFVETEDTLLADYHGYELRTGIVTANGVTKLDEPQSAPNMNSIEIGGESYTDLTGLGTSYLGERVYYLFDIDEESVAAIWVDDAKTKTVTIKSEDIAPTTTLSSIEVYTNEEGTKKERYKIDANGYTIKNDVANATFKSGEDYAPQNGYVTLVDNDNDGVYEIVKVYKPTILVVDSVYEDTFSQKLSLADKAGNEPEEYNYEVLNIKSAEGKQAAVDNLIGNLIYVYPSDDKRVVNIQIMPEAIVGVANGKSGEEITIDGIKYKKTAHFNENYDSQVAIGKSATFYTDLDGKLVAVLDVSTQGKSQVIAVIQKFVIDTNSEEYAIKIYDETGSSKDLKIGDFVVVDGAKMTLGELAGIQDTLVGKLAYATVTEDSVLKVLVTDDETLVESSVSATGQCTGTAIFDDHTFKCNVNPDAPVFTVPVDRVTGMPLTQPEFAGRYSVRKMGDIFKSRNSTNTNYVVYGMDEYMSPTFLMRKVEYDTASNTFEPCNNVFNEKTACVVKSVRENIDQYGDLSYTIEGVDIASGKTVKFTTATGLEYAVNYAKLSTRGDFQNPETLAETALQYNHKGIKKAGLIAIDNYTDYLTPFVDRQILNPDYNPGDENSREYITLQGLQTGDIVRYCKRGDSVVKEIDLIAAKSDFSGNSKVIYTVGDYPSRINASVRLQRSVVEDVKDGYILFPMGSNTESIKLSTFTGNIVVIENGKIESYPMSSAGIVLEGGDKILVHTSEWAHVSIICLKD